ncbi:hypothetical protein ES288_D05G078000v1 [Gossypium darwinii]|uniref:Uncharacterized protein n=1 Tax=Gossypium darwinii TaxID=34276 RepID=A0A5D2CFF1_GOSDA|nr:hypothetical protein ES288_D05G078000v1 [Gossypium darwinii]
MGYADCRMRDGTAISETAKAASNCSWLWTTHCARLSIFYVHFLEIIAIFCM